MYVGLCPAASFARREARERLKFKKSSLLVKLVILIVLVYATVTLVSLQNQVTQKKEESAALSEQVAQLQQANNVLQESIDNLQTSAGIEAIARNKLGLVKDGEIVFYDNGE